MPKGMWTLPLLPQTYPITTTSNITSSHTNSTMPMTNHHLWKPHIHQSNAGLISSQLSRHRCVGWPIVGSHPRRWQKYWWSTGTTVHQWKACPRDGCTPWKTQRSSLRYCSTQLSTSTLATCLHAHSANMGSPTTPATSRIHPQHQQWLHTLHHHWRAQTADTCSFYTSSHDCWPICYHLPHDQWL